MEWRSLELQLISCTDLRAFNFFRKLSVYSVIAIVCQDPNKKPKHLQRNQTCSAKGSPSLEWDEKLKFDLQSLSLEDVDRLFLEFDLRCRGIVDRSIGEVSVPLKDLMDESKGAVRFVSYQIRNSNKKPNGVLNFSFKLVGRTRSKSDSPKQAKSEFSRGKTHYPVVEEDLLSPLPELGCMGVGWRPL